MNKKVRLILILALIVTAGLIGLNTVANNIREAKRISEGLTSVAENCGLEVKSVSIQKIDTATYDCTITCSKSGSFSYPLIIETAREISNKQRENEYADYMITFIYNGNTYDVGNALSVPASLKKNGKTVWEEKIETETSSQPKKESSSTNKTNESKSGTDSTNTCTYKYLDGSVCGAKTNRYTGLCDKHFEELYETYQSLGGTKVPKY